MPKALILPEVGRATIVPCVSLGFKLRDRGVGSVSDVAMIIVIVANRSRYIATSIL